MTSETAKRQKLVDRYFRAANIGTAAIIAHPFLYFLMLWLIQEFEAKGVTLLIGILLAFWFVTVVLALLGEAYSIFYVFFRRNTDEFTQAMWHAGTTFAFFAAILWLMVGGWIENSFDSASATEAYREAAAIAKASGAELTADDVTAVADKRGLYDQGPDIIRRFATPVILAAFFLGFNIKRLRG